MKYTIKTPVEGYTGISASLHFFKGEAHTDDDKLAEWFMKHKYQVICEASTRAKATRKKGGKTDD